MTERERIACHEAAHAVAIHRAGGTIAERGIDLNEPTSDNTTGIAVINLYDHDPSLPEEEQRWDLVRNLIVICAGAVSDAKIRGGTLREALAKQSSDEKLAFDRMDGTHLFGDDDTRRTLQESILEDCLKRAQRMLHEPEVWDSVQKIAKACIENGGKLSKTEIETLLPPPAVTQVPN